MTWATQQGARYEKSADAIGMSLRTIQRWSRSQGKGDQRRGPRRSANRLSDSERKTLLDTATSRQYADLPPSQIIPDLADQGIYLASESTLYRLLRKENLLTFRQRSARPVAMESQVLQPTKANELWSWDITLLRGPVRGQFYRLYLIEDVYSRKIVGWEIHEREDDQISARLVQRSLENEGITQNKPRLHSDNGSAMKGAMMIYTLQQMGVIPSFSRPGVSNDNPYSEALFRTLKYRPDYPYRPFQTQQEASKWVESFVAWYNHQHRHKALNYVTPHQRHTGEDQEVLKARHKLYESHRAKTPERWSRHVRRWLSTDVTELTIFTKRQLC